MTEKQGEILEKIRDILEREYHTKREAITMETQIEGDLGMDSLDRIEMTFALEEEFKINIPDTWRAPVTIEDAVNMVEILQGESK